MDASDPSVADGRLAQAIATTQERLRRQGLQHPHAVMSLDELGNLFETLYMQTKDIDYLHASIDNRVEAVRICPYEGFYHAILLNSTSRTMMRLFDRSADLAALGKAERYARRALAMYPYGNPNRLMSLHNISIVSRARFEHCGTFNDLEESIALTCEALALGAKDGHERVSLTTNLAFAMKSYFERTRQLEDLDFSIDFHRESLAMIRGDRCGRSEVLRGLCESLEDRFERSSQSDDLEAAIACRQYLSFLGSHESQGYSSMMARLEVSTWIKTDSKEPIQPFIPPPGETSHSEELIAFQRANVAFFPVGHDLRPKWLCYLTAYIMARFMEFRRLEDFEELILLTRELLTLLPTCDPIRASVFKILMTCLQLRYVQSRMTRDIGESVIPRHEELKAHSGGPGLSEALQNVGIISTDRFKQEGQMEYLEEAISLYRAALALLPEGHPNRSSSLNNLATSVLTRFERKGQMEDLEEAISLHRVALALRPEGHPNRSLSLNNLAISIVTRFEKKGQLEDLEEAIRLFHAALVLRPEGHPDHSLSLNNLATALCTRFEQKGKMEDLEEAIILHRAALALCPEGHTYRSSSLYSLGNSVWTRFQKKGQMEDLEEAISLYRAALALRPEGHPDHSSSLSNLATALCTRFEQKGQMEDLEEAISLHRAALALFPEGHTYRSSSLFSLAISVETRFRQNGRMEDLEEAISLYRAALALRPEGHPDRSASLNNLATAVWTRFQQKGQMEDLEEAISLHRVALALCHEGHTYRWASLNNLANSVWTRFRQNGWMEDLEEAIGLHRAALVLCHESHPNHSLSLSNLATTVWTRFQQSEQMEDLEEAISLHRTALALCHEGHPNRSGSLENLAGSILTRFQRKGEMEDLEEATSLLRAALALCPEGHPNRSKSLSNLAASVLSRFERKGQVEDLEEAISLYRAALALCPEGHPDHSVLLNNLAASVLTRFQQNGEMEDLNLAMQSCARAADDEFSSLESRLDMTVRWSSVARSHCHPTALRAYEIGLSLLERSLTLSPTLRNQHDHLSSKGSIARLALDAASYAIEMGDLQKAIEMLEQGRGFFWSQMRGFRTPLDSLVEISKPLADRFQDINQRLQALSTSDSPFPTLTAQPILSTDVPRIQSNRVLFDNQLNEKRRLLEEQKEVITQIRDIPGFEDFLKVTPFETLKAAAEDGPVVMINRCSYRCDVLILLCDSPPAHIPLDADFYKESVEFWMFLVTTRREFTPCSIGYNLILGQVMQMLWDRVVSLVVEKLKELGVPDGAHVWWCPTSILSEFPFHAAGPFESADGRRKYFLDNYVSSYTPTLKALIDARRDNPKQKLKLLIVAPEQSHAGSLPSVEEEIQNIYSFGMPTLPLINDEASRDAVVKALREHTWVHFTCHGSLASEPFDSSFKLFDSKLTLYDIAQEHIPNAEFAFLSACHTADQSTNFAASDEVLHLAAGMQFCGFRSVIGTMWQMADIDGPHMAREVYSIMSKKQKKGEVRFKRAAAALRAAVLELKERFEVHGNTSLERWVNYVHIGA